MHTVQVYTIKKIIENQFSQSIRALKLLLILPLNMYVYYIKYFNKEHT